jgi:hypothetical protein
MALSGNEFLRLESLIFRPVSTRPDWLKAWRNEANYLLFLARRAEDADDIEMLEELEEQAREMADMVEAKILDFRNLKQLTPQAARVLARNHHGNLLLDGLESLSDSLSMPWG